METKLEMKERHRIERLKAKNPPIGILLMILIPLFAGTLLTLLLGLFWGLWYWMFGGMIFSYNSFVVHKRFEEIADRQRIEINSIKNPLPITEVLD